MSRSSCVLLLAALVFVVCGAGCDLGYARDPFGAETAGDPPAESDPSGDTLPDPNPESAACDGQCLHVPPAPFNDRIHLIHLLLPGIAPECTAIAPDPGMFAYVLSMGNPMAPGRYQPDRVQECLTTPDAGQCPEGKTCAPLPPDQDYALCISRENLGPCPVDEDDYPTAVVVQEPGEPAAPPVTLCCKAAPSRK